MRLEMSPTKTKTNPLGAGRNPRAGEPADYRLTIRLTVAERAAYQLAAAAAELTLTEWVRAACAAMMRGRRAKGGR